MHVSNLSLSSYWTTIRFQCFITLPATKTTESSLLSCLHPTDCPVLVNKFSSFFREQKFLKMLPHDWEKYALQPIRQNLCLQTAEHQAGNPTLTDHSLHTLRVSQRLRMALLVNFDDADRVGAGVADRRGGESEDRTSSEFFEPIVLLRNFFRQQVIGEKPWIVADKCGRCGGQAAVVESEHRA